jgi:hypothetical protein
MTLGIAAIGIAPGNQVVGGQTIEAHCTFSVSGLPTDPTTIQASVRFGTASATSWDYTASGTALLKDSTGVYHFDFISISAGTYYYRFQGTSACQAAAEGAWDCLTSKF